MAAGGPYAVTEVPDARGRGSRWQVYDTRLPAALGYGLLGSSATLEGALREAAERSDEDAGGSEDNAHRDRRGGHG
jgi:hypothetical protein